jgi:hypothetical protein
MRFLGSKVARRVTAAASAVALASSIGASGALAGGPPSLAFYVDDVRYRTVGTPTDFFGTGAPESSYDKIFNLGTGINVGEAKPGDRDFNGGRWAVLPITWHTTPVQLTSAEQVEVYANAGWLSIGDEPVRLFFCSVSPVPPGQL